MNRFSRTFYRALDAVFDIVPEHNTQQRFGMGQPVWAKNSYDRTAFIVLRYVDEGFMEIVRETDLTGPVELAHESYFVDAPPVRPSLHADQPGIVYFTSTGRPIKQINGGRRWR